MRCSCLRLLAIVATLSRLTLIAAVTLMGFGVASMAYQVFVAKFAPKSKAGPPAASAKAALAKTEGAECMLIVRFPETTYKRGEKIVPELEYKNLSDRDVTLFYSGFCVNHRFIVKDEAGGAPPLTAMGTKCRDVYSPGGPRDGNRPIDVKAGESHFSLAVDVATLYELETGERYMLEVVYDEPPLYMASRPVPFKVIEPDDAAKVNEAEHLLTVTLPKMSYKPGERIVGSLEYRNRNGRDLTIWDDDFCLNHKVVVKDEAGKSPALTEKGRKCRDAFAREEGRSGKVRSVLKAGMTQFMPMWIDVATLYELEPGEHYTLEVVYDDHQKPEPIRAISKPVRLRMLVSVAARKHADPSAALAKAEEAECLLIVSLPETTYKYGAQIIPEIEYENQSSRDLTIWSCGFCPNHEVVVKDEAGASPPLTARGKKCRDAFAQGGNRDKNYPIVIGPGKTHRATGKIDVASLYELQSGKQYVLGIVYDDPLQPTPLKMSSKAVKFKVE